MIHIAEAGGLEIDEGLALVRSGRFVVLVVATPLPGRRVTRQALEDIVRRALSPLHGG